MRLVGNLIGVGNLTPTRGVRFPTSLARTYLFHSAGERGVLAGLRDGGLLHAAFVEPDG